MLKKVKKQLGLSNEFLYCDWCGEGIGIKDNPTEQQKKEVNNFKKVHQDCKKEKHPDLDLTKI